MPVTENAACCCYVKLLVLCPGCTTPRFFKEIISGFWSDQHKKVCGISCNDLHIQLNKLKLKHMLPKGIQVLQINKILLHFEVVDKSASLRQLEFPTQLPRDPKFTTSFIPV